jgi:hypothetical protein
VLKNTIIILYIAFCFCFIVYLSLPLSSFPEPPSDAIRSFEPADVEDDKRRGYYTDLTREQVIKHYREQFNKRYLYLPSVRLNYPPEESQTIIRDQTRSTYLEELVHPFRESIFINGFEPKLPQDLMLREGKYWDQKIIIKHVSSGLLERLIVGLITLAAFPVVIFLFSKNTYLLIQSLLHKKTKFK